MEIVFLLLAGAVVTCLQVTSFGFLVPSMYKPDLMLVLVVWLSLRVSFTRGIVFAFCAGIVMDNLSGSPTGLSILVYCTVHLTVGYLHGTFRIDSLAGWAGTVFMAVWVQGVVVLAARLIGGPVEFGPVAAKWIVLKSLITSLAALAAIPILDRLRPEPTEITGRI